MLRQYIGATTKQINLEAETNVQRLPSSEMQVPLINSDKNSYM
jgi:hypothetical protein